MDQKSKCGDYMMYSVQQSCKIVAYLLHTSLSTVFNARNSVLQKLKFKGFKLKKN